jgi:Domain of unknown function (DUF4917)
MIKASQGTSRAVLLGNGFSIAQGGGRFSYSNLLEICKLAPDSPIRKVFQELQTVDFEVVMKALEDASHIARAYGDAATEKRFAEDASEVREALIAAVHEVHPGVHFEIPQKQRQACGKFLTRFIKIFTLNYDLLLYWVILGATRGFHDGFGLGDEVDGFRTFRADALCDTYYLHGALHLFLDQERETLKCIVTGSTIINDIANTIRSRSQLPLIVAEGTAVQKIARIRSVPYLHRCYSELSRLGGTLFIFGHGVSTSDSHIYDAICKSGVHKVFFCVHKPAERLSAVREDLARYLERARDIDWIYVDAATADVWGLVGKADGA